VETTSLDKIVEQCEGRRIDFLKMDCEGAEWEILTQCSEDALSQVDRIRMEFHPRAGRSTSEIIDRLVKFGF
jgi:FkbM family methyltransferase